MRLYIKHRHEINIEICMINFSTNTVLDVHVSALYKDLRC